MRERQRTSMRFSLRRLFAYTTVICVATTAIIRHLDVVLIPLNLLMIVSVAASLVVPTLLVCAWFALASQSPRVLCFAAAIGACIGASFAPGISANAEQVTLWMYGLRPQLQPFDLLDLIIPPFSAAVIGGIGWIAIQFARRPVPSESP